MIYHLVMAGLMLYMLYGAGQAFWILFDLLKPRKRKGDL